MHYAGISQTFFYTFLAYTGDYGFLKCNRLESVTDTRYYPSIDTEVFEFNLENVIIFNGQLANFYFISDKFNETQLLTI